MKNLFIVILFSFILFAIILYALIVNGKSEIVTMPVINRPAVDATSISTKDSVKYNPIDLKEFYAPILFYHHIAYRKYQNSYYVSPEIFSQQMLWLKDNNYNVITMDDFYKAISNTKQLPEKPVVITFDDSLLDQYENAYPILKQYNYSATFFVKLNNIGKQSLSWEKIKEMSDNGMTIGSHSVNHDNMAAMSDKTLNYELQESKKQIEEHIGVPVKYFCYPGGAYSNRTVEAAKNAGYLAAFTTKHKVIQEITNENSLFMIPRIHIDDEMPTFIDWVKGENLK